MKCKKCLRKGEELEHYSPVKGIKQIDPNKTGQNLPKEVNRTKMAWFYRKGSTPESVIKDRAKSKYVVELPNHVRLYDLHTDPDQIVSNLHEQSKTRQMNPGVVHHDELYDAIKNAGYHGVFHSGHPTLPHAVGMFDPQSVKEEQPLDVDFSDDVALKHATHRWDE